MSGPRLLLFEDLRAKADYLDAAASRDALTIAVRRLAFQIASEIPDVEVRARALHRFVRDRIAYRHDRPVMGPITMGEQFADSGTILARGVDDCDGKSRLLVALVRADPHGDIEARVRPVFPTPDRFSHVQAELRWDGSERWASADPEGWILAETILRDCELGDDPEKCPRDARNQRALAGPQKAP